MEIEQTYVSTEQLLVESSIHKKFNIKLHDAYPNPAQDRVYLTYEIFSLAEEPVLSILEVYNIYGRRIYEREAQGSGIFNYEINISDWPAGVYIYKVNSNNPQNKSQSKKFIIN